MAQRARIPGPSAAGTNTHPGIPSPADPWGSNPPDGGRSSRASELVRSALELWVGTIETVVAAGYGLTVSGTRDGGAICLSLLRDGQAFKKYAGDPAELEVLLRGLQDHCRTVL